MKKILIILIIGLILLNGCGGFVPECDKIINLDLKDGCYRLMAQTQQNPLICEEMSNKAEASFCSYNIEITLGLPKQNFKEDWYTQAILQQDESLCGKINTDKGLKYGCYSMVAQSKQNPLICNKISEELYKGYCLDDFKS